MNGSARSRARAAGVIAALPLDAVQRLWEDLLTSGASRPVWNLLRAALARGGAASAIFERFSANPRLRAAEPAEESVSALLEHVALPEARVRSVLGFLRRAQTFYRPFLVPVASSTSGPV